MVDEGRVAGDPTEVLTRSGGTSYVSLTGAAVPSDAAVGVAGTGSAEAASPSAQSDPAVSTVPTHPRPTFVGPVAAVVAVVAAVLTGLAVGFGAEGEFGAAAGTAIAGTVVSIVAVLGGLAAIIGRMGWRSGVVAVVVGLLANPLLLTRLLEGAASVAG